MSIAGITLITALRAALIALLAVSMAASCAGRLRSSHSSALLWLMLLALLMPPMVMGYHVATTRAAALGWSAEFTYCALVFVRVAPLAMILVWLWPPAMSSAARFSFALMSTASLPVRCGLKLREWLADLSTIFCVVFIVAFQEFDLAACMNARSWTIALFDAQAGGLALSESLRLMLCPLAIECAALAALLLGSGAGAPPAVVSPGAPPEVLKGQNTLPIAGYLALLCIPLTGPLVVIYKGFTGLSTLQNFALTSEANLILCSGAK